MRIWIDFTDFMKWRGPVTGIQRVVVNMALELRHQDIPLSYFKWNGGFFEEIDSALAEKALVTKSGIYRAENSDEAGADKAGFMPQFKRLYDRSPSLGQRLAFALRRRIEEIAILGRRMSRPWKTKPLDVAEGDAVLILGNNWDASYMPYLWSLKRKHGFKLCQIIYDLIPIRFPRYFRPGFATNFERYIRDSLENSDILLAISQNTKADLLNFANNDGTIRPEIDVIRLGDTSQNASELAIPSLIDKPFVLTVGTVEIRKNHAALFKVWRSWIKKGERPPLLVMSGRKGWLVDDLFKELKDDLELAKYVVYLEQTSDAELAWLYRNCLLTLYPSFYEGWGLPVAEALTYGKICIASNTSAIPEISPLVDLVDPHDVKEIANSIAKYCNSPELRDHKENLIRASYQPTTWQETTASLLTALKRTI